jgi:TonB-linked SusC/RagA family outer membrane protein
MKEERYKKKTPFRKFVLFFLLISFSCFNVMAQEKNESINMQCNNERLTDALKKIEKMSDYKIIFSYSELQSIRVNATIKDATAPAAVKILLTGQPLTSTVDGKYIRIFSDTKKGLSQKGFFTGKVIDESGEPLPGVSIRLKNSNMGVLSDANGTFRIPAHGTQSYDFVFTFIGKRTLEKKLVEGRGQIITLEDFVNAIDEVVVTGYQTVNRRESASAISTIAAKDIMVDGASTIDQMLQGKIPGMAVMNTSGEPSATPKIRIRGNATINGNKAPVWVVDGVILEQNVPFNASDINSGDAEYLIGNAISGLNPQDIETITVLKDASATAIYGVKAANGVIVITTKKGHYGKPTITYNGDITINTRPSYSNYNLMSSQQRVEFSKQLVDAGQQFGRVPVGETYEGAYEDLLAKTITLDQFRTKVDAMQVRNTNWFKYLFRNNITHNHTANISGGSDNLRYYMSAGFSDVEGSAKKSDSRRFNSIARVDALINKHINFQAKINFSTTSNKGYSSVNPFNYAYNTTRTIPAYNDDGSYYMVYAKAGYSGTKNVGYNVLKELDTTGQSSKMDNFDALFRLNINVFDGLKYEGTFSWSNGNTASRNWATDQSYYIGANYRGFDYGQYTAYDSEYWDSELPYGGILSQSHTRKTGYTIRNQVQYNKVFNQDHAIDLVGGIEARRNAYKGDSQTGYGWTPEFGEKFNPVLTSSYISYILEAGNTNPSNTNSFTQVASYYGIASYAYKERYVLNANIRSDGSNKFGSNPKYRWLPTYSFAVKWNMMNENFMKQMKWIDVFSFRGSYGIQGNISENDSPYLILKVGNRDNILGLPKSTINKLPNPDLRWEKTDSWDLQLLTSHS